MKKSPAAVTSPQNVASCKIVPRGNNTDFILNLMLMGLHLSLTLRQHKSVPSFLVSGGLKLFVVRKYILDFSFVVCDVGEQLLPETEVYVFTA